SELYVIYFFKFIWQRKIVILAITLLFLCCGVIYSYTAQQLWTSSSLITKAQYLSTFKIREKLASVSSVIGSEALVSIDKKINPNFLFERFMVEFNSYENKKEFILSNNYLKDGYLKKKKISDKDADFFIKEWTKKISSRKEINNDNYFLFVEANTPKASQLLLTEYTSFINAIVQKEVLESVDLKIKDKYNSFNSELLINESYAKEKIKYELKKTQYSLDIAKASGIEKPIAELVNQSVFSIDLGSKALAEKERVLNKIKDLELFEPNIINLKVKINQLSTFNLDNISFSSIKFLEKENYPYSPTSPNRVFVLVLSIILGVITGLVVVFIREAVSQK
ncbi:Wzz/FepE/Etk N-terminal domain-containing protein, partial [Photobacterium damselae]|uniref:Wzz/FepE/Etk N-terminal domain-containing protein n=1 Tax=Photobacterium damselae TaxID=38293 RepID=UPI003D7D12F5